jgi:hypothetical protein
MSFFQGLLPGIFGRMEDPTKAATVVPPPPSSPSVVTLHQKVEDSIEEEEEENTAMEVVLDVASSSRKRNRSSFRNCGGAGGTRTPTLRETPGDKVVRLNEEEKEEDNPPAKRRRGIHDQSIPVLQEEVREEEKKEKCYIAKLPEDILTNVLSYCSGVSDRFALQCTNKQFKRISDKEEMKIGVEVGGDKKTGLHGIVLETDTPESAAVKLRPYAKAGNLEAIYMYVTPTPSRTLFLQCFFLFIRVLVQVADKIYF